MLITESDFLNFSWANISSQYGEISNYLDNNAFWVRKQISMYNWMLITTTITRYAFKTNKQLVYFVFCPSQNTPLSEVHPCTSVSADPWGRAQVMHGPTLQLLTQQYPDFPCIPSPSSRTLDTPFMVSPAQGCGSVIHTWFPRLWLLYFLRTIVHTLHFLSGSSVLMEFLT